MNNITVIIINYKNEEEVLDYAKMLSKQTASNKINIIIVNNKKSDNCYIDLKSEIKKINISIDLFEPKENLGYLNGTIYGYNEFTYNKNIIPDWVVISNTDIEINDKQFFEKFLSKNYDGNIWCVAPSVYAPNSNSFQNPQYIKRCSLHKINRLIFINKVPFISYIYWKLAEIKAKIKKSKKQESQYIYSAHGCFFALKNEFIEKIKNNSYGGFLYSEEAYIAENILMNRKKCFYDARLEVIHNENSVTGLLGMKKKSKYIVNSLKYIREEFYLKVNR